MKDRGYTRNRIFGYELGKSAEKKAFHSFTSKNVTESRENQDLGYDSIRRVTSISKALDKSLDVNRII